MGRGINPDHFPKIRELRSIFNKYYSYGLLEEYKNTNLDTLLSKIYVSSISYDLWKSIVKNFWQKNNIQNEPEKIPTIQNWEEYFSNILSICKQNLDEYKGGYKKEIEEYLQILEGVHPEFYWNTFKDGILRERETFHTNFIESSYVPIPCKDKVEQEFFGKLKWYIRDSPQRLEKIIQDQREMFEKNLKDVKEILQME